MKKETKRAIRDAFAKLSFRSQAQNPVMLMVYLSACLTTVLLALALAGISDAPWGYIAAICVVLWATVLFGNFAESLAEGRGKAQADALRSAKRDVEACLIDDAALADAAAMEDPSAFLADRGRAVGSATLKRGQVYHDRRGRRGPLRARRRRGHHGGGKRGRKRDYRRIGAGRARERRRSVVDYRRHDGALRLAGSAGDR